MFCNFDMFSMTSTVLSMEEGKDVYPLFMGTFEDISNYMAAEYQTHRYDKIVLAGPYAEAVQDRIVTYSIVNYNQNEINIEIVRD